MITRQDIAYKLEYGIRTGFLKGVKEYTPVRSQFARETPSTGAFETYTDMGEVPWPVQNAGVVGDGGVDPYGGAPIVNRLNAGRAVTTIGGQSRAIIVYNVDYEITLPIQHNAIDDDRAGDVVGWAQGAGRNFERHKDWLCFTLLNQGESSTYIGYDKLPLFSASHVDPGAEYITVQSNLNLLALSLANFRTVRTAASKFKNDRGQSVGFNHSLLIVPSDLEYEAYQIASNPEAAGTANRDRNPYAGRVTPLIAPGDWLDSTAWFLADVSQVAKPVNLQIRKEADLKITDDELAGGGGTRFFKWHARYTAFIGDWRLIAQGNS